VPSSRPNTIPTLIHIVRQLRPASILDVGVGFGKWGHLFREYTDIVAAEHDPKRYKRKHWQVRIDGIEGHAGYITSMHRFLYNKIFVGDALQIVRRISSYDLIFLGDIIEHFDKADGLSLVRRCVAKAKKAVVLSTPKYETLQADLCGNELERHRSVWAANDFREFPSTTIKTIDGDTLLVVITRTGLTVECTPPKPSQRGVTRRMEMTRRALLEHVGRREKFIVVDEDQMRSELPHRNAIPFLERHGQYWGPPSDDETAIRELERLRQAGVKAIAFTWPCFWWLDHYKKFATYLRKSCSCRVKTRNLIVWDLPFFQL
jgi:hypothetical protein